MLNIMDLSEIVHIIKTIMHVDDDMYNKYNIEDPVFMHVITRLPAF
jgi:hypothetical protein